MHPALLAVGWFVLGLSLTDSAPVEPTAWQRELLARVAGSARSKSLAARRGLEERLSSPEVRAELAACSPETAELSAEALAERLRNEVGVSEVISGFDTPAMNSLAGLTLEEAVNGPGHMESQWEVGHRRGFNFSSTKPIHCSNLTANDLFTHLDEAETQLYGLRPFKTLGAPTSLREVYERPPYALLNLHRLDSGSQLYGDVSVVLATSLAAQSSLVSSVDTGGWKTLCNNTPPTPLPWPTVYKVNCSAYQNFTGLGTLQDFDHVLLQSEAYWKTSISRVMCRMLAPWGSFPLVGTDLPKYWEALPATQLPFPGAVKFIIGTFDGLFGSEHGALLQRWCQKNGWVLVWSLGLNVRPAVNFWTVANVTWPLPSNRRLADPLVLAHTSAGNNVSMPDSTRTAFLTAWGRAEALRRGAASANQTVGNATWASEWQALSASMPGSLHVAPLSASSCSKPESCVGVSLQGNCMCYHADTADIVV